MVQAMGVFQWGGKTPFHTLIIFLVLKNAPFTSHGVMLQRSAIDRYYYVFAPALKIESTHSKRDIRKWGRCTSKLMSQVIYAINLFCMLLWYEYCILPVKERA